MGGEEEDSGDGSSNASSGSGRKAYWRSQSWSASRSASALDASNSENPVEKSTRRSMVPPLTPRSQQHCKARFCLPPLQPLSIARRSVDEWPMAGSDDVGEWPQPPTPSTKRDPAKPGEELRVDISLLRTESKRNQIAFFDKECSKVAEHIYLGGDAVAKNRDILLKNGITHVLNCVGFVCPEYFKADFVYKTLWLQDSPSEDITSILYDVFDYFEDVREQNGRVFVHCCQGVSRSTSLVIAYLMWRKGQSFEDAFDFVKAARGIANPNMGFACQLLQCQKRVHAVPLSPNSVLRMYRMAPHSPYDALHLVPKMLNDPSPSALDSRGAFILHVLSSMYVWIGKNCKPVMENEAKAAAYQVVRYERVPGPIFLVQEGDEPLEFWEAFVRVTFLEDTGSKVCKEQLNSGINIGVGKRKVEAYDVDFELFYKGLAGGVLPPFSSLGAGHETHLPARESNWSILRRKFISGGMKSWASASKAVISRVYSDTVLARDTDVYLNRAQLLSVDSLVTPPYLSPSSLNSDSSNSSKSSSDSPSDSPTIFPSITESPCSLDSSNSEPSANCNMPTECPESLEVGLLPSKPSTRSLAERRKSFAPSLKLPKSMGGLSKLYRGVQSASVISNAATQERLLDDGIKHHSDVDNLVLQHHDEQMKVGKIDSGRNLAENSRLQCDLSHCSSEHTVDGSKVSNSTCIPAYRWPDMKKFQPQCRNDFDPKAVYIFLVPETCPLSTKAMKLYLWVGSCFSYVQGTRGFVENDENVDWNCVGLSFLNTMDLQKDIPIKVLQEEESDELLKWLYSF